MQSDCPRLKSSERHYLELMRDGACVGPDLDFAPPGFGMELEILASFLAGSEKDRLVDNFFLQRRTVKKDSESISVTEFRPALTAFSQPRAYLPAFSSYALTPTDTPTPGKRRRSSKRSIESNVQDINPKKRSRERKKSSVGRSNLVSLSEIQEVEPPAKPSRKSGKTQARRPKIGIYSEAPEKVLKEAKPKRKIRAPRKAPSASPPPLVDNLAIVSLLEKV